MPTDPVTKHYVLKSSISERLYEVALITIVSVELVKTGKGAIFQILLLPDYC